MLRYTEKVIEHFRNPRNWGALKDANSITQVGNPTCGDVMKLYLKIEKNIIQDISFETLGCAAAIAVSSALTEYVKGKNLDEAYKITKEDIVHELGDLPPVKMHCSMLGVEALHKAIDEYRKNFNN